MGIDLIFESWMRLIEVSWLISFSKFIAVITEPVVLIIVSLIVGLLVYFLKSKKEGLFFPAMIIVAGALVKLFKWVFSRARPLDSLILETGYSFPSGHATIAIVFFGLIGFMFWKKHITPKIVLPLVILLIGFTRLYLRVHWFTDVLGGYVLGGIILALGIWLYKKI